MLVLSRQRDETIMIGDDIEVTVVDIRGDKVRLGITAPKEISVHRKEVYDAIRRENRALQSDWSLRFHPTDNDQLIAYAKTTPEGDNVILTVVNLDPYHAQSGWLEFDAHVVGIESDKPFQVHDLLSNQRFVWQDNRHFIRLDPNHTPAHVFRLRRRVRSEQDFDYFL